MTDMKRAEGKLAKNTMKLKFFNNNPFKSSSLADLKFHLSLLNRRYFMCT